MKITYIHHSSFLVEMEQIALLFDYLRERSQKSDKISC